MKNITSKNKLIILVLTVVVFLTGITIYLVQRNKNSPFYSQKVVDQCTGNTYSVTPNQGPEKYNTTSGVSLLGAQPILDSGATQAQFQKIQEAIAQYSKSKLNNRYQNIEMMPGTFKANSGLLTGQLCLGQKSNIVNMAIRLSDLKYVEVSVSDPTGKNGGDYDSGQLSIDPNFYQPQVTGE